MCKLYVIACNYVPVMGGVETEPDKIHVFAATKDDALWQAKIAVNNRPLYPLSCWTAVNFTVLSERKVDS